MYIFRKQIATYPDTHVVILQTKKENGHRGIWHRNQATGGFAKKS